MSKGSVKVIHSHRQFLQTVDKSARAGLHSLAWAIHHEAVDHIPIEHGNLVKSGRVTVVKDGATLYRATVAFVAPYAAAVHYARGTYVGRNVQRPSGIGVYWSPNGQPQYLRIAAKDVMTTYGPGLLQNRMALP